MTMFRFTIILLTIVSGLILSSAGRGDSGAKKLRFLPDNIERLDALEGQSVTWDSAAGLLCGDMGGYINNSVFRCTVLGRYETDSSEYMLVKINAQLQQDWSDFRDDNPVYAKDFYLTSTSQNEAGCVAHLIYSVQSYHDDVSENNADQLNLLVAYRVVGDKIIVSQCRKNEGMYHVRRVIIQ